MAYWNAYVTCDHLNCEESYILPRHHDSHYSHPGSEDGWREDLDDDDKHLCPKHASGRGGG